MLVTVVKSERKWETQDGMRRGYVLTDSQNNVWETMSDKMAASVGQTFDCEVYQNKSGKTYLRQVPKNDGGSGVQQTVASQIYATSTPAPAPLHGSLDVQNLSILISRLEVAVAALEQLTDYKRGVIPPNVTDKQLDAAIGVLGGEVEPKIDLSGIPF
jgi:hypothetical protein